ncbi:MAG: AIPR family protein [Thermodesulfobacteriota bacterium]|jgi:hypothetical protein
MVHKGKEIRMGAFNKYLQAEVRQISQRERLSADKAFLFWFAINVLDLSEGDAREAISIEGSNDKGIDIFWVDDDEGRIVIAQGKYSGKLTSQPKISHITKLESSLNWLSNPEALRRDGKADLAQAADDYIEAVKQGYGVELWFVYTGSKCPNIDKHISVYNQNRDNIERRRTFRHYHIDLLQATWEELEGASRRIDSDEIAIVGNNVFPFEGAFGKAMVATVQGSEIVRLHEKYEERLFDRNVRLFLGVRKGSVNAGIAETLRNKSECGNFWAYNNGITIVCDDFSPNGTKVKLTNFSIVNGCQTAVSLAQSKKNNVSDVAVLVRFIAAPAGIVDDIIRYTNSQNPIRTWDIASQDRTQRRLQAGFEKLSKPFIYLTRRGARPKTDLNKYREGSKLRQIRVDIMGQYAAAFRDKPVLAYKHKAFIFSRYHDEVFPPDVRVEEVLFEWICGDVVKEVVQEAMGSKKETELRILKKGGTLFVLAAMSRILSLRNGATYLSNCSESPILGKATLSRIRKYGEYARHMYVQAVMDQNELEKAELATLVRQPDFYNKVIARVERQYEKDARASEWLKEALPPINLKGN